MDMVELLQLTAWVACATCCIGYRAGAGKLKGSGAFFDVAQNGPSFGAAGFIYQHPCR